MSATGAVAADAGAARPSAADFLPLEALDAPTVAREPTVAQWRAAWRLLRRDPGAMAALAVLLLLFIGSAVGPVVWPVDPARQMLDQVSRPPTLGNVALLVADPVSDAGSAQEQPVDTASATTAELRTEGVPSTRGVRLRWDAHPRAESYAIYRHELSPRDIADLGLPLAGTVRGGTGFDDRLALENRLYYYSVLPQDAAGQRLAWYRLPVEVRQGIGIAAARERGLLHPGQPGRVGETLRLEAHPLGTDYLGRDMLARIIQGSRTSLFVGICAPLLYVLLGVLYGGVAGYCGGRVDNLMMRLADFVVALPFLLFMILIRVAMGIGPGESGVLPMVLALVLLGWPSSARLVRAHVLRERDNAHVQAARLMGAGTLYLVRRHLLPGSIGIVLVSLSFAIPSAIFTEAFLSFIGLGVVPPTPSWGSICNDGMRGMLAHPHELLVPAAFIAMTVLAFNRLGDALRDALALDREIA